MPTPSTGPQILAVWQATDDEPEAVRVFTPNEYTEWAEHHHLADAETNPTRFYGLTPDGALRELTHTAEVGPYDENAYATVTHTWVHDGRTYATGQTFRDGRA